MTELPSFKDLPVKSSYPAPSSWGVWGAGDKLGCWNTIDEAAIRRGAACVRGGRTFSLNAAYDAAMTTHMGRTPLRHGVQPIMGVAWDDVLDGFNTQASTQWDGFGHFGSRGHGHYGGLPREGHGVDAWAERGFATRGVLADLASWRESVGRPIDVAVGEMLPIEELALTLEHQGSVLESGDVLLVRFGWLRWWRETKPPADSPLRLPGIEPSLRAAEMLWDSHIAAVAGDPGLDPIPGKLAQLRAFPSDEQFADPAFALDLSLHNVLPYLGLSIGEFFDLDALAADCAADRDWTCMVTTAPMQLPGGVATPANAIAIR